jgi:hypothetical protein
MLAEEEEVALQQVLVDLRPVLLVAAVPLLVQQT